MWNLQNHFGKGIQGFNGEEKMSGTMKWAVKLLVVVLFLMVMGGCETKKEDPVVVELELKTGVYPNDVYQSTKECFDEGRWHNYSWDIIVDYGLSCSQIDYLNKNNGYGETTAEVVGFISQSILEAELVGDRAVDGFSSKKYVRNIGYHLDCNNSTMNYEPTWAYYDYGHSEYIVQDTFWINYYEKADLVNYYVGKCID